MEKEAQAPSSDPWGALDEFDKAARNALENNEATMQCVTNRALPSFLRMLLQNQSDGSLSASELAEKALEQCNQPSDPSSPKVPIKQEL